MSPFHDRAPRLRPTNPSANRPTAASRRAASPERLCPDLPLSPVERSLERRLGRLGRAH
ncbi:DUF6059 family protein [Streptomyces sp. UG1]|uniref:DUF6059 family protein n=1 Tax=Streptomyces sp. UG1 TaxID=3417652 RepID=UPI003CFA8D07